MCRVYVNADTNVFLFFPSTGIGCMDVNWCSFLIGCLNVHEAGEGWREMAVVTVVISPDGADN